MLLQNQAGRWRRRRTRPTLGTTPATAVAAVATTATAATAAVSRSRGQRCCDPLDARILGGADAVVCAAERRPRDGRPPAGPPAGRWRRRRTRPTLGTTPATAVAAVAITATAATAAVSRSRECGVGSISPTHAFSAATSTTRAPVVVVVVVGGRDVPTDGVSEILVDLYYCVVPWRLARRSVGVHAPRRQQRSV